MLPSHNQGRCAKCGHFGMIHGSRNNCHHMDEWEGDGPAPMSVYCQCDGFARLDGKPVAYLVERKP